MKRSAHMWQSGSNAEPSNPKSGRCDYIPASLLVLIGLGSLSAAWMASGANSGQYLVIASPGSSLADTINLVRAANGGLVEKGRFSNIVIAGSTQVDFPAAARRAGAWLAIAAPAPGGCIAPLLQEQSL